MPADALNHPTISLSALIGPPQAATPCAAGCVYASTQSPLICCVVTRMRFHALISAIEMTSAAS